ncbi:MAG: hypothetical protein ABIR46_00825 [Candidatus Saccharimonadales bacterium]
MSNWSKDFLNQSNTPHSRVSGLYEGEKSLCELARLSEIEYAWEYDPVENLWHYSTSESQILDKTTEEGIVTGYKMGLGLSTLQSYPLGNSSTFYHIHPSYSHDKIEDRRYAATFPVQSQIPSSEDFEACVRLRLNGYQHFKIVTAMGITALNFDRGVAESSEGNIHIKGVSIPIEKIAKSVENAGTVLAVQEVFEQLNEHFDGTFILEFESFQL